MKCLITYLFLSLFYISSLYPNTTACDYAGSNISYIQSQTKMAIEAENLNLSHYFAYKALNAIEKSKNQFEECGCESAVNSINEGLDNLKKATRVSSLSGAKIFLERALENTEGSLEALEEHEETHTSEYANDILSMNTKDSDLLKRVNKALKGNALERKIDSSLISYKKSLEKVVQTVDCEEALAYATRIFEHCELELLKPNLTEGKKYYNLRTKQITGQALEKLRATCTQ